jgi:hypothetical protein
MRIQRTTVAIEGEVKHIHFGKIISMLAAFCVLVKWALMVDFLSVLSAQTYTL